VNECREIVEHAYNDPKINEVISKINPTDLQADLKQEFALILLEYNCEDLIRIKTRENFTGFALRIIYNLAYSSTSPFYYKYKKSAIDKAREYLRLTMIKNDLGSADTAQRVLDKKLLSSAKDAHESIIFQKYVELRNCVKVAEFFGIPQKHVFNVVKETKKQLKNEINKVNR